VDSLAAALTLRGPAIYNGSVTSVDFGGDSSVVRVQSVDRVAFDIERVAVAVHYVIAKAEPGKLGHVKLNKILWYADLEHFRRHGASITGLTQYSRAPQGPLAADISRAVGWLGREGCVTERSVEGENLFRREMLSLQEPDTAALTDRQRDILERMTTAIAPLSAHQLLLMTQKDVLWQETEPGEPMLVSTGSVITRSPTTA